MGRELSIYELEHTEDGSGIIHSNDFNLCGRTDFTSDIASLFYREKEPVSFLLVSRKSKLDEEDREIKSLHVQVEDDFWDEKEFEISYGTVLLSELLDIVFEHTARESFEVDFANAAIEDARIARQHSASVEMFEHFSELLRELGKERSYIDTPARRYQEELMRIADHAKIHNCDIIITLSD